VNDFYQRFQGRNMQHFECACESLPSTVDETYGDTHGDAHGDAWGECDQDLRSSNYLVTGSPSAYASDIHSDRWGHSHGQARSDEWSLTQACFHEAIAVLKETASDDQLPHSFRDKALALITRINVIEAQLTEFADA
jgi:hypothetical protein